MRARCQGSPTLLAQYVACHFGDLRMQETRIPFDRSGCKCRSVLGVRAFGVPMAQNTAMAGLELLQGQPWMSTVTLELGCLAGSSVLREDQERQADQGYISTTNASNSGWFKAERLFRFGLACSLGRWRRCFKGSSRHRWSFSNAFRNSTETQTREANQLRNIWFGKDTPNKILTD